MIINFPKEHRPRVEVFSVRDRTDGRKMYVFELVGRDECGPYRIDMSHRYTLEDVYTDVVAWWREGIDVVDTGMLG